MQTHILIINHQLAFAVSIKQALERTGNFEVHPFTSLEPALEYLRGHLQDVALVDFTLPGVSGNEVVARLRQLQPTLAIIATPRQPEDLLKDLALQGTVNTPISAREIIPVVNKAIEGRKTGKLSPTQAATVDPYATELEMRAPDAAFVEPASPEPPPQEQGRTPRPGLLGKFDEGELLRHVATRQSRSKPPTDLPEYTSIDNVLSTVAGTRGLSQPPTSPEPDASDADDTGSDAFSDLFEQLPSQASPALPDDEFSALLEELDSGDEQRPAGTEFDDLVNSMRAGEPHKPLPTRHQQFVEFILTGGMDPLLEEIEQKRTDELPAVPADSAPIPAPVEIPPEPEPDLPQLEDQEPDEGTVGDLFTGVSDTSFRNVLSILRGEEILQEEDAPSASADEMREAYPQFFSASTAELDDILNQIESQAQHELTQHRRQDFDFEEPGSNTARMILETAESTPLDSFSISDLINSIEKQLPEHRPKVQPLPSWIREDRQRKEDLDRYVREPDFLPEELPEFPEATIPNAAVAEPLDSESLPEFEFTGDWYDQTTRLSSAQRIEEAPESLETQWLPSDLPEMPEAPTEEQHELGRDFAFDFDDFAPVEDVEAEAEQGFGEASFEEAASEESVTWDETESYTRPFPLGEMQANLAAEPVRDAPETLPTEPDVEQAAAPQGAAAQEQAISDPYIAQLALSLTEVSLELTAEATLLTRDGAIVAYAGRMAREELDELRDAIHGDWDANPDEARIRFVNLEGSGKDYMLFSRRTVDELTLSLVFSGTTPLRDIRRQGKRLIEALQAVPEVVETPEAEAEAVFQAADEQDEDDGLLRMPYTYVWLMRDPDAHLSQPVAQAIVNGMNRQLRERSWRLHDIQAKGEYVYLLADVPGETPPYDVIRDLKRRAAEIAHDQNPMLDPDTLWADSYLVVTPGRSLEHDEIQQYIQFERTL